MSNTAGHKHLIVVGCPRSGTTLLAAMLGAHSQIALLNEVDFRLSKHIFSKPIVGSKLTIPTLIDLDRKASQLQYVLARLPGISKLYRKTDLPWRMEMLLDFLGAPDLYCIGIVRDPESTIASNQRRGGQSRAKAEARWKRSIDILDQMRARHQRTLIVRYDHLVSDPEQCITEALAFLGCSYEASVLDGVQHTPQYPGRDRIDATKAISLEKGLGHPVFNNHPGLLRKYQGLIQKDVFCTPLEVVE